MIALDAQFVSFLVRLVHVLAMAALVGGALLLAVLPARVVAGGQEASRLTVTVMAGYEWLFWLALGLLVMTGVGNVGAFAGALPPPDSAWGSRFTLKLAAVVLLALLSAVRTAVVFRVAASEHQVALSSPRLLKYGYGATAAIGAMVVALAVSLRHA